MQRVASQERCSTVSIPSWTHSGPYTEGVQLRTLGGLRLEGAVFSQPKPLLLLAYLALEGPQERWHLAELLWPSSVRAMGNLRTVLSRLRGVSSGMVEVDGVRVWTAVDCDAQALLTALEKDELQSGLELYRGPFLDGLSLRVYGSELEEWVYHTREYLAGRVREALLSLAEIQASHRGFRQAIEQAERAYLLACAPAPEPQELERFHTLFVAGGSHHAKEVREEGLGFGLSLVVSVAEAKERLRSPQQEDERNGLRNLPDQRTSFVGRALELSEVTELLVQPDCRLLSVVGAGGVGKTRLALKIAQQRLEAGGFADGVVFVPLEAHTSAATIPAVVADALGLTLSGQEDASSVVLRFLAEKRLLLVLDNFEQLLGGTVFVRELTRNCPRLKLLVTSRMKLNLEQEWIVTVEGMTFPEESTTLERAAYFDAVQLFSMRARRAQPGFSLTAETLPAVARICQLVHGMPLAIELAASWLRALPVSEVAKEMEAGTDRLESLTQDVPERHRSVRAVFDHSWSLLSQREKEVLRRLSVFRGGFRREAAAVVSGATLPVLARLVDKSLLYMSLEGRYDRHPLLAQYTREKLAELPEERAEAEQKHGSYYLGLVRDLEPDLWTLERKEALRVFLGELANIRASWDWAAQNLEVDEIEKTTPAMYDFFTIRLSEGLEHFGTTLEFFGSIANHLDENNPSHAAALGTLLVHQVFHAFMMHQDRNLDRDLEQERSLAERGVSLLESVGEPRALAKGYHTLGIQAGWAHFSDAEVMGWHERALAVARKHQSTSDIGHLLWLVGWQLMM